MKHIEEIITSIDIGHSALQMDLFVTEANGITTWGCYRQAVLETRSRFFELRRSVMDALIMEAEISETQDIKLQKNSQRLALYKRGLELQELLDSIDSLIRELARFYAQADTLRTEVDADTRRPIEQEQAFWLRKMELEAAKQVADGGRISAGVLVNLKLMGSKGDEVLQNIVAKAKFQTLDTLLSVERLPNFKGSVKQAHALIMDSLAELPGFDRIQARLTEPIKGSSQEPLPMAKQLQKSLKSAEMPWDGEDDASC